MQRACEEVSVECVMCRVARSLCWEASSHLRQRNGIKTKRICKGLLVSNSDRHRQKDHKLSKVQAVSDFVLFLAEVESSLSRVLSKSIILFAKSRHTYACCTSCALLVSRLS